MINPSNSVPPPIMESTLQIFQAEPEKNVVINQPPQNSNKEIFEFNNYSPSLTRISQELNRNIQNENVIPIQQVVNINKPVRQITQVTQSDTSPQISYVPTLEQIAQSKISQVIALPQINQSIISQVAPSTQITQVNIPIIPEKIVPESVVVSQSQKLPDINTSQINASQILPIKVLPKITRQVEILPVQVLPTIEQGNEINSGFENVSQINKNGQIINVNYNEKNQTHSKETYELPQ